MGSSVNKLKVEQWKRITVCNNQEKYLRLFLSNPIIPLVYLSIEKCAKNLSFPIDKYIAWLRL